MSDTREVGVTLKQVDDYEFRVRFEGTRIDELTTDEAAPLGRDAGPNPSQLLLTSVANCLAASLLFALRKFKNTPAPLHADARAHITRNAEGRWRVGSMDVDLTLDDAPDALRNLERALAQFEDFCIVTESVRSGVEVNVRVRDADGTPLHQSRA